MSSCIPVVLADYLPKLIRLTWKLISFLLPLLSIRPLMLLLVLWPPHGLETHTHTQVQSMTRYTLILSIVSAGVNSPPHQAQESVLSRMAEYPGPLPSPPLLRYPSMVYFCPCISLLSAKCLWCLPLQQTDEGCQWWVAEDRTANQNNLSNASHPPPPLFKKIFYILLNHVEQEPHFSSRGAIIEQRMSGDDDFSNLLSLFSLIESHYNNEMLFLCTKAIK